MLEILQLSELRSPSIDIFINASEECVCFNFKRLGVELIIECEHGLVVDLVFVRLCKFSELLLDDVCALVKVNEVLADFSLEVLKFLYALCDLSLSVLEIKFNLFNLDSLLT